MNSKKLTNSLLITLIVIGILNLVMGFNLNIKLTEIQNMPAVIINESSALSTTVPVFTSVPTTEPAIESIVSETFTTEPITEEISTVPASSKPTSQIATEASTTTPVSSSATVAATTASTTSIPTTQKTPDNSGYCYVTNSGTKYHRESCSYLSKSRTQMTISEAERSGYSPCSRCY